MNVQPIFAFRMALIATLLGLLGCSHDGTQSAFNSLAPSRQDAQGMSAGSNARSVVPPFDPASFVPRVDNPYFPLTPGTVYSYVSRTADGVESNQVEVTRDTKTIVGVRTTVVHDRVDLDGSLIEDTFDWYAQDGEGNVWYFGEDTKQYDHGVLVGTVGSWEAGKNGAKAGIIMLAHPQKGDEYPQEESPGVVADRARVVSLSETVTVPYGTFSGCLQTMDWTPLEPGVREFKFYARGIGTVLELTPRGGRERVELTALSRP